jgi:hypothetical protein
LSLLLVLVLFARRLPVAAMAKRHPLPFTPVLAGDPQSRENHFYAERVIGVSFASELSR